MSQSPQIGANFRTQRYRVHGKWVASSLNPLKSGQTSGLLVGTYIGLFIKLSQSPQIGANFRTDTSRGGYFTVRIVSIPSNRGKLPDVVVGLVLAMAGNGLNPLKSGQTSGPTVPECVGDTVASLNPLKSGQTSGHKVIHPDKRLLFSLNPLKSGQTSGRAWSEGGLRWALCVSIPSNRGKLPDCEIFRSTTRRVGCLNPLKSGQTSGPYDWLAIPEGAPLSQSPQIGANFRT